MAARKIKSSAKIFTSNQDMLKKIINRTANRVEGIVGSSLGPGGKISLIESSLPGIPDISTKDGVTIFRSLGTSDPYEHLIIEQWRDVAIKTAEDAGDGPQPLYSKVLTPNGFVNMGEIEVGMEVCGVNQTTQKVIGVFPKGKKEICRVTTSDGKTVECCEDHLWGVTTSYGVKKTVTTKTMIEDFVNLDKDGHKRYRYYLPVTPVSFSKKELLMDPYLLGVLLGDGSFSDNGSIELSLGLKKKHILDKIKLPIGCEMNVKVVPKGNAYRAKIKGIRGVISALGLLGKGSDDKFIPKEFLFSSIEDRKQLLQGLLDTDGCINSRGLFEFSTVSERLKNDFMSLVRSLGVTMYYQLHSRENDKGSYSDKSIHRITELKGYTHGDKIVNIEKTGEFTEMQCIKVSNSDHLYVTDDFAVTHNTTTATILSAALINNLFAFCEKHTKYSPQRGTRVMQKLLNDKMLPFIEAQSIKVNNKNKKILKQVAKVSANGDGPMADAVMDAFEAVGYGASSHVTIQQLSGPNGFSVELIEGFPINKGYEESIGKFHTAFINDQANQRCLLEKPLFILFDGNLTDIVQFGDVLEKIGDEYANGNSDYSNVVLLAHGFSDKVLTTLSFNFANPNTINVVPLKTPMNAIINSELNFLLDLSAFTGAKIFDMTNPLVEATPEDFGSDMDRIEIYRFRTTVVGEPDPLNVESRAEDITANIKTAESKIEKSILEERLGKLTNGIARLKIFGSSNGDLKEMADRAEDAVCAVRAAIKHGCLPGGCRVLINLALELGKEKEDSEIINEVIIPSLLRPFHRLLSNAGYLEDEIEECLQRAIDDKRKVFNIETGEFDTVAKLGIYDATLAVKQALINAISISKVLGTLGGIVCFPRDGVLERQEATDEIEFQRDMANPNRHKNEANERF